MEDRGFRYERERGEILGMNFKGWGNNSWEDEWELSKIIVDRETMSNVRFRRFYPGEFR